MLTCFIMLLESVGEIVFDITGMELFKQLKNTMNLTFCGWNPWSIPQRTRPVALLCAHLSLNQMSLLKDCWIFSFYSSDTPTSAISIIEAFKLKKHLGAGPSQKCPAFPLTITTPSWSWCFPQGAKKMLMDWFLPYFPPEQTGIQLLAIYFQHLRLSGNGPPDET